MRPHHFTDVQAPFLPLATLAVILAAPLAAAAPPSPETADQRIVAPVALNAPVAEAAPTAGTNAAQASTTDRGKYCAPLKAHVDGHCPGPALGNAFRNLAARQVPVVVDAIERKDFRALLFARGYDVSMLMSHLDGEEVRLDGLTYRKSNSGNSEQDAANYQIPAFDDVRRVRSSSPDFALLMSNSYYEGGKQIFYYVQGFGHSDGSSHAYALPVVTAYDADVKILAATEGVVRLSLAWSSPFMNAPKFVFHPSITFSDPGCKPLLQRAADKSTLSPSGVDSTPVNGYGDDSALELEVELLIEPVVRRCTGSHNGKPVQ